MQEFKETKFHFGPLAETFNQRIATHYIIDQNIYDLYKDHFKDDLIFYIAPAGENSKNFKEVEKCLNFFLEKGIDRKSHIVVIGGGATSDFGGFVASILLRGISWSVMPTTLLSMVDSSIGGKTGVNSSLGKNLIGSFHLPKNVWIDLDFLKTLPQKEIESGMGEILKYSFLDPLTYKLVKEGSPLEKIVKSCIEFKNKIVKDDFKEAGQRKILNLGHTIGHALELHYKLSHGEAVRWGLYLILESDELKNEFKELNLKLTGKFEIPPWFGDLEVKPLLNYIKNDKKKINHSEIELIGLKDIGKPKFIPMTFKDLQSNLEKLKND